MDGRNLTMLMDFYELTMANGYFKLGLYETRAAFDLFYRRNPDGGGFAVFAGLEQVVRYIESIHFTDADIEYLRKKGIFDEGFLEYLKGFRFTGSIDAVREGTIIYPNTPLITVTAPLIEAQIIETAMLLFVNHQSLIATKANRICRAARGATVMEFGARRAQGADAAEYGTRAAYIGGVHATATASADMKFGVPAVGTMAHSWIQLFPSEYDSFKAYAELYPDACTLLIDTYSVIKSGVPNAIRTSREVLEPMGKRLKGVRIDSGDIAYLSKYVRRALDAAGLTDCKIVVSNSIDEHLILSLNDQGAQIDSYGIGERLITAKSDPVFGGVYKLVAVEKDGVFEPRIKISENVEKIINPAKKMLYRMYNKAGKGIADLLTLEGEKLSPGMEVLDSAKPWKRIPLVDFTIELLQVPVFRDGELVYELPTLHEIREYVARQLRDETWEEETRFINPHIHYLNFSEGLYDMKMRLLQAHNG
ncbi:MAG: nicotinate phosphoribosyltransferase [Christensenellales bacterium]|jgi:nicotinate phosphoribosyltransferase